MGLIKPNAIAKGATLGIVSPSSSPRPVRVSAGVDALHRLGYRTKLFPNALAHGPLYYAGTAEQRAADFHAAFADPEVDAVICTRGGWGAAELLPLLDAELARSHAKAFLGYSDQTSIHLWLRYHAGLVSFQAPMVAADFSKREDAHSGGVQLDPGVDLPSWNAALSSPDPWELGETSGLRTLRDGSAEGELLGGCLSIYTESLGTPWAARHFSGVLFLEDIGVKPYQWDRMLVHLRLAGCLRNVTGIIFGDMGQCCPAAELPALEASLLHALRDFKGPIGIGLRSGHVDRMNVTLPFGVRVRLSLEQGGPPRLQFLEPAVRFR